MQVRRETKLYGEQNKDKKRMRRRGIKIIFLEIGRGTFFFYENGYS